MSDKKPKAQKGTRRTKVDPLAATEDVRVFTVDRLRRTDGVAATGRRRRTAPSEQGQLSPEQRATMDPKLVAGIDRVVAVTTSDAAVATRRTEDRFAAFPHLREEFLRQIRETGSRDAACSTARVRWSSVLAWAARNPEFADELEFAIQEHRARIEGAIYTRAIEGIDEQRFSSAGVTVGFVKRYSDPLLIAYAKRHIPEYRQDSDRKITVDGTVSHAHVSLDSKDLDSKQRSALRLLLTGKADQGIKLIEAENAVSEPLDEVVDPLDESDNDTE
jgi:hypothetical protein